MGYLVGYIDKSSPVFSIFLKQQMWKHPVVALFRLMPSHVPLSISQTINLLSQHSQWHPQLAPSCLKPWVYPTAGELTSNCIASSLRDMPYSFTAQYHKLFSFIYITYFFTSVSIPTLIARHLTDPQSCHAFPCKFRLLRASCFHHKSRVKRRFDPFINFFLFGNFLLDIIFF